MQAEIRTFLILKLKMSTMSNTLIFSVFSVLAVFFVLFPSVLEAFVSVLMYVRVTGTVLQAEKYNQS